MASVVVDKYAAFDFYLLDLNRTYDGSAYHRGSTVYRIEYSGGAVDVFRGTDLRYNSSGELIGGTIRSYQAFQDGDWKVTIRGYIPASAFTAAARTTSTEDDMELFARVFRGADSVSGSLLSDFLKGFGGNDTLRGFAGNDVVDGDAGADAIIGGLGGDTLVGGPDNARDAFIYGSIRASGETRETWDRILQFDRHNAYEEVWDRIDLSRIDADNELSGNQKFRFVSEFTKVGPNRAEGQVRIRDLGDDVNVHVDLNGDMSTDMIINVARVGTLSAADFLL